MITGCSIVDKDVQSKTAATRKHKTL